MQTAYFVRVFGDAAQQRSQVLWDGEAGVIGLSNATAPIHRIRSLSSPAIAVGKPHSREVCCAIDAGILYSCGLTVRLLLDCCSRWS